MTKSENESWTRRRTASGVCDYVCGEIENCDEIESRDEIENCGVIENRGEIENRSEIESGLASGENVLRRLPIVVDYY